MSSLGAASRETGRSRSPNPFPGHKRSPERGVQDEFPASDAAPSTSHRAAVVTPVAAATKPAPTTSKPAWGSGGRPATTAAATRGRPLTRGRPVNTSRSLTPNQPKASSPAPARPSSLGRSSGPSLLAWSRSTDRRDALPQASARHAPPIAAVLDSTPQRTSAPQLVVIAPESTGDQLVSTIVYMPHLPDTVVVGRPQNLQLRDICEVCHR